MSCRVMKGAGCTSAVGSGSPRTCLVVQAMHPRGRSDPHPIHAHGQMATKLPQGRRDRAVRKGALDALHCSQGFVATNSTPAPVTKTTSSQRTVN
eukprot:6212182-Pleurochrysis_carterae.AAC.4